MNIFFIGILAFLLSGIIAILHPNRCKLTVLSILSCISSGICLTPAIQVLSGNDTLSQTFWFNPLFGNVCFAIDSLSAFFIMFISVMSTIAVIYSKTYLKPYIDNGKNINSHILFLTLLIASMLAVVSCHNALMFLICWELMSLSSFFLVIFEDEKKDVLKSGIKYLVFMHISVLFIIAAFAMMSIQSGNLDFSGFKGLTGDFANLVFLLSFIGFGTKAGFVPFHNWLPDAHPSAPSHVSGIMSGVMIKTGIYGILRTLTFIGIPSKIIAYSVLVISVLSALYGVLYAITQHDLKRLLAYHSIENIGIIGIGLGTGMLGLAYNNPIVALLGFAGGMLHILNHSIFKELLFLSAGSVYIKTHTKDVEILGGLIKSMPYTAILFLIGSVAICGLPPFNGFISEILVYFGMFNGLSINNFFVVLALIFGISALALVGTMAILCFSKAFSIIFLGSPRDEELNKKVDGDNDIWMILPMSVLAVFALLIGIFPQHVFKIIEKPVSVITSENLALISPEPLELLQTLSLYALGFIVVICAVIALKLYLTKGRIKKFETWGCGYNKPNPHMQYTASSYASPFLSMLKPLFKKVFDIEKPRKLFPKSAHFSLHIDDIEEAYLIDPIVKGDEWFLSKFETLQSGNLQSYIKYGLVFLFIVVIGCLFIG